MNYFLTEDQKMMKDLARQVAREKMLPVREHYDETEEFPWEIVKEFASTGLSSVPYPKEYGGLGGGNFELVLIVEELSKVCAGIPLALAATFLGALPILIAGTDEQKQRYIPPLAKGEKLAAFAITEPEAGSDAGATKTTAKKDGDAYILNGSKIFCTNGGEADTYSILAMTDRARGHRGGSFFVLEKGTPGFTFGKKEKKLGIRASATRELIFQNCRVPAANRLGREGDGFIVALRTLDRSRPGIASQALGIAAGALEDAVAYARQRKQFGQAISSFQAIQHMLADMAMQVEAARALTYATCRMMDADPETRTTMESAMSKCFASDVAMKVTTDAVQIFGGYGYIKEFPVEKRMRDAKICQIYEGTNQIQRNEIAYALIRESAKESGPA